MQTHPSNTHWLLSLPHVLAKLYLSYLEFPFLMFKFYAGLGHASHHCHPPLVDPVLCQCSARSQSGAFTCLQQLTVCTLFVWNAHFFDRNLRMGPLFKG